MTAVGRVAVFAGLFVLAVLVALFAPSGFSWVGGQSQAESESPRPSDVADRSCDQVGSSGDRTQCVVIKTSGGSVEFEGFSFAYYHYGDVSALTSPPRIDPNDGHHCAMVLDWSLGEADLYSDGSLVGGLTASGDTTVAVRRVEVEVLERVSLDPDDLTVVLCQYHAGADAGSTVLVDPATGEARLQVPDGTDFVSALMPPAVYRIGGREGYGELSIELGGEPNVGYEGIVVIHVTIDGKQMIRRVGSRDRPFKWVNRQHIDQADAPMVGWNSRTERWEPVDNAFDRPGSNG